MSVWSLVSCTDTITVTTQPTPVKSCSPSCILITKLPFSLGIDADVSLNLLPFYIGVALVTLCTGRHEAASEALADLVEQRRQEVQHQLRVQVGQHRRTPPQLGVGGRQNDLKEVWQPGGEVLGG